MKKLLVYNNPEIELEASAMASAAAVRKVMGRTESPKIAIEQVPAFSDDWLALAFTKRHADDLRYCALWGQWLHWDSARWKIDETKKIFDLVRKVVREIAVECNEPKVSKQIASSKTIAAVKTMTESDRQHATHSDEWDADLWLLNTPTCTVDLRTGEKRGHSKGDYITRIAEVGPGGECPNWLAFLDRITGGNKELQAYLQRVVGYALTGMTTEHAMFFLYGTGANGKSVFLNTIKGILAEYQKTAPIETFIESHSDKHPTDLAGLRGARLVTAVETEQGRRWAESKIKTLTGGDPVSARFMRQDFFEFTPQFKLLIAGNHKPTLRSVDEAIKRRFNLIPFTVTIPAEERDPDFAEKKLQPEWPGILGTEVAMGLNLLAKSLPRGRPWACWETLGKQRRLISACFAHAGARVRPGRVGALNRAGGMALQESRYFRFPRDEKIENETSLGGASRRGGGLSGIASLIGRLTGSRLSHPAPQNSHTSMACHGIERYSCFTRNQRRPSYLMSAVPMRPI
jgi:putative DNA primase/helicase